MVVYICTEFHEIFLTVFKLKSGHDFQRKKFKGAQFRKNIGGIKFFFSAHRLMVVYICIKFYNIPDGIKVVEWTRFS